MERRLRINNDPFLPPLNEHLVVTHNLNSKHRIVYNKYGLIKYHILFITKEFEAQDTPLDYYDIEAMLIAKSAVKNGIVFFNYGANGGASQPHKHMQWFSEDNFDIINEFNNNWYIPKFIPILKQALLINYFLSCKFIFFLI